MSPPKKANAGLLTPGVADHEGDLDDSHRAWESKPARVAVSSTPARPHLDARVGPLFVGPSNSELVVGQRWRWVRDTARRLGVPILRVGGKPMIRAAELAAALEREAAARPVAECSDEAERAQMRAQLGLVKR